MYVYVFNYFVEYNRSRLKAGIARCAAKRKNITIQILPSRPTLFAIPDLIRDLCFFWVIIFCNWYYKFQVAGFPPEAGPPPAENLNPATCNLQPATCNLQLATCNLQPVKSFPKKNRNVSLASDVPIFGFMVPRDGIEPPTQGFSVPCSTG